MARRNKNKIKELGDQKLVTEIEKLQKQLAIEQDLDQNTLDLSDDNYIYLNCIKGNKEIIKLHNKIYNQILPSHFKKSIKYVPHITLGQANNIEDLDSFEHEFKTIVDEISIELIGEHEESIIIKNIKLGDQI